MVFHSTRINTIHYDTQPAALQGNVGLTLAEPVYKLGVSCRLWLYRTGLLAPVRLPVPVISIGNLTTGGTGKTPIVIALAQWFEAQGKTVAVLSRGYGARIKTDFHEANHPDYGDEPYLIQKSLNQSKVFVGKNRVATGKKAIQALHPDVILLDDGFQHLRLHRDINILLVDGEQGFGNGRLLPAGPLREPLEEIRRADWVLMTKHILPHQEKLVSTLLNGLHLSHIPLASCPFEAIDLVHPASGIAYPPETLNNQSVILLSAIAQPQAFQAMAERELHIKSQHHFVFPDHARFTTESLRPVVEILDKTSNLPLLTTEKDWVKLDTCLPDNLKSRVYLLRIAPQFWWQQIVGSLCDIKDVADG